MLAGWASQKRPADSSEAASRLPVWFRQAVAALSALPQGFDGRGGISSRLGTPIPLAEIFAARSTLADSVDRTEIEGSDPVAMRDRPRALLYMAEARSIAQFLAEKEGAEYIGLMGERLLAGQSVEAILQQAKNAPKEVPALETAWRAWLRSEERR